MNYAAKWNKIDSVIFFCENKIKELGTAIAGSNSSEPDVELMILAETEHLRIENENLRKRELPVYLIEENGQYFCPKCKEKVPSAEAKYCSNCGRRLIRHIPIRNMENDKVGRSSQ